MIEKSLPIATEFEIVTQRKKASAACHQIDNRPLMINGEKIIVAAVVDCREAVAVV